MSDMIQKVKAWYAHSYFVDYKHRRFRFRRHLVLWLPRVTASTSRYQSNAAPMPRLILRTAGSV